MYYAANPYRAGSYHALDAAVRIEAADPHELVAILFEHVLLRLERARRGAERGDTAAMLQARARASEILNALEESLDFERGGEVAPMLAVVYREAAARINRARGAEAAAQLHSAHALLLEIRDAWAAIRHGGKVAA